MNSLETEILKELKVVTKNNNVRWKDVMEWSTSKVEVQDGETSYFLPVLKIYCAVRGN